MERTVARLVFLFFVLHRARLVFLSSTGCAPTANMPYTSPHAGQARQKRNRFHARGTPSATGRGTPPSPETRPRCCCWGGREGESARARARRGVRVMEEAAPRARATEGSRRSLASSCVRASQQAVARVVRLFVAREARARRSARSRSCRRRFDRRRARRLARARTVSS